MWFCVWQVVHDIFEYNSAFIFRVKQSKQNSQSSWPAWPWRCIMILCNVCSHSPNNRTGTLWSELLHMQRRQFQQVLIRSCISYMLMALWTVNIKSSSVGCTVAAVLPWSVVFIPRLLKVGESFGWMKRHCSCLFSSFFNFFPLVTVPPLPHTHSLFSRETYDSPDQAACCDILTLSAVSLLPHVAA